MIDVYFLTFGYLYQDKESLKLILEEKLNIKFEYMSGDSYGYRFGDLAESISIVSHYEEEDDWWSHPDYKNYPLLINASITQGKNKVKEQKALFFRQRMLEISGIVEIKFSKIQE